MSSKRQILLVEAVRAETEMKMVIETGPEINTEVVTEEILEKTVEIGTERGIIEATLTGAAETTDHVIPEADPIMTESRTEMIDLANQFWMNLAEI